MKVFRLLMAVGTWLLYVLENIEAGPFSPPIKVVNFNVNIKKPVHTVSDRFLSITIDPNTLLRSSDCEMSIATLNMARGLAPAYIRIAGPDTNKYIFEPTLEPSLSTHINYRRSNNNNNKKNVTITALQWIWLNEFIQQTGLDMIVGLNGGIQTSNSEIRDFSNALQLITFSDKYNYNLGWQLGYDLQRIANGYGKEMGRDVARLRKILEAFPNYYNSPIIGPDMTSFRTKQDVAFIKNYLTEAGDSINAMTWHPNFTALKDGEDPANALLSTMMQLENYIWIKDGILKPISKTVVPKKSIWIGESEVKSQESDFTDAMLWLRKLGIAAKMGISVYMRKPHQLSLFEPTPEYWIALIHKALVGKTVLDIRPTNGNNTKIHVFSHCTQILEHPEEGVINPSLKYENGAITIFGVNTGYERGRIAMKTGLKTDESQPVHQYILTEIQDDKTYLPKVALNGQLLGLSSDDELPMLSPRVKNNSGYFTVPARSMFFFVLPDVKCKICTTRDDEDAFDVTRIKKINSILDDEFETETDIHDFQEASEMSGNIVEYVTYPKRKQLSLKRQNFAEFKKDTDVINVDDFVSESPPMGQEDMLPPVKYVTFNDDAWLSSLPLKLEAGHSSKNNDNDDDFDIDHELFKSSSEEHDYPRKSETPLSRSEKYNIFAHAIKGKHNITSGGVTHKDNLVDEISEFLKEAKLDRRSSRYGRSPPKDPESKLFGDSRTAKDRDCPCHKQEFSNFFLKLLSKISPSYVFVPLEDLYDYDEPDYEELEGYKLKENNNATLNQNSKFELSEDGGPQEIIALRSHIQENNTIAADNIKSISTTEDTIKLISTTEDTSFFTTLPNNVILPSRTTIDQTDAHLPEQTKDRRSDIDRLPIIEEIDNDIGFVSRSNIKKREVIPDGVLVTLNPIEDETIELVNTNVYISTDTTLVTPTPGSKLMPNQLIQTTEKPQQSQTLQNIIQLTSPSDSTGFGIGTTKNQFLSTTTGQFFNDATDISKVKPVTTSSIITTNENTSENNLINLHEELNPLILANSEIDNLDNQRGGRDTEKNIQQIINIDDDCGVPIEQSLSAQNDVESKPLIVSPFSNKRDSKSKNKRVIHANLIGSSHKEVPAGSEYNFNDCASQEKHTKEIENKKESRKPENSKLAAVTDKYQSRLKELQEIYKARIEELKKKYQTSTLGNPRNKRQATKRAIGKSKEKYEHKQEHVIHDKKREYKRSVEDHKIDIESLLNQIRERRDSRMKNLQSRLSELQENLEKKKVHKRHKREDEINGENHKLDLQALLREITEKHEARMNHLKTRLSEIRENLINQSHREKRDRKSHSDIYSEENVQIKQLGQNKKSTREANLDKFFTDYETGKLRQKDIRELNDNLIDEFYEMWSESNPTISDSHIRSKRSLLNNEILDDSNIVDILNPAKLEKLIHRKPSLQKPKEIIDLLTNFNPISDLSNLQTNSIHLGEINDILNLDSPNRETKPEDIFKTNAKTIEKISSLINNPDKKIDELLNTAIFLTKNSPSSKIIPINNINELLMNEETALKNKLNNALQMAEIQNDIDTIAPFPETTIGAWNTAIDLNNRKNEILDTLNEDKMQVETKLNNIQSDIVKSDPINKISLIVKEIPDTFNPNPDLDTISSKMLNSEKPNCPNGENIFTTKIMKPLDKIVRAVVDIMKPKNASKAGKIDVIPRIGETKERRNAILPTFEMKMSTDRTANNISKEQKNYLPHLNSDSQIVGNITARSINLTKLNEEDDNNNKCMGEEFSFNATEFWRDFLSNFANFWSCISNFTAW